MSKALTKSTAPPSAETLKPPKHTLRVSLPNIHSSKISNPTCDYGNHDECTTFSWPSTLSGNGLNPMNEGRVSRSTERIESSTPPPSVCLPSSRTSAHPLSSFQKGVNGIKRGWDYTIVVRTNTMKRVLMNSNCFVV